MVKKVIIKAVLVPESLEKRSKEIELEILREILCRSFVIPWCYRVEKVRVIEE